MTLLSKKRSKLGFLTIAALALVLLGCPADSPTAPGQNPSVPDGGESTDWGVSVAANPTTLTTGDEGIVTVEVTRKSDGMPAPDNATVVVTTDLGTLGSQGNKVVAAVLKDGLSEIVFAAGAIAGEASIIAHLEDSEGEAKVSIVGPSPFYVESVSPSHGLTDGGNTVTVRGAGFQTPLRVFFGMDPGTVKSSTSGEIKVVVPPGTAGFVDVKVTRNFTTDPSSTTLSQGYQYESP